MYKRQCQMCSGALVQSRIDEVVIGCMNAKAGCAGSVMNPVSYTHLMCIRDRGDIIPPQYISADAVTDRCLIGEGAEIYGEIHNRCV